MREEADNDLAELLHGTLCGAHIRELERSIEVLINRLIDHPLIAEYRSADYNKKLLTCYQAAKEFLRGKEAIGLGEIQYDALKIGDLRAIGVAIASSASGAAEVLSRAQPAAASVSTIVDNRHFMEAAISVGQLFCECMAVQEGKTQAWIKDRIFESDRGTPHGFQNRVHFARWYARELCDLAAQREYHSLRLPISETICATAKNALLKCLRDQTPTPGEHALAQMLREETQKAAQEMSYKLPNMGLTL